MAALVITHEEVIAKPPYSLVLGAASLLGFQMESSSGVTSVFRP